MIRTLVATCALLLASCGPKTISLPDDPIERAATCGSVAAAAERAATADFKSPLSLEAIGRVIHYPLLAGAAGGSFSSDRAAAVQKRMAELQDSIVEGKWQEMVATCHAAFPATAVREVVLPADRFQAQVGCDELSDFLRTTLDEQEDYMNELAKYRDLSRKLEPALAAGLPASDSAAQKKRSDALAAIAMTGPPVEVLRKCVAQYG